MLGMFNGVFYSSIGLVSLPAPYIGAYLWENFTPKLPFYITAFVALATIIPSWLFFKIPPSADEELAVVDALPMAEGAD